MSDVSVPGACNIAARGTDELSRLTRALKTVTAGHRTLLHASDEKTLLEDMCAVIVDAGYCRATVGYAVFDEAKSIELVASAGKSQHLIKSLVFNWGEGPSGQTAIGTAIRTGQIVHGRRILSDPAYAGPEFKALREEAARLGYSAAAAFPLHLDGKILGALAIVTADPEAFDEQELELLAGLVDNLVFGIANLRTRKAHLAAEATIMRLAYYDELTGLPNRSALASQLHERIELAAGRHEALALLHVGVGRYREIMKVLGDRASDTLLVEVARRLAAKLPENVFLARVGESDFALVLDNTGAEDAMRSARQLQLMLLEPVSVQGLSLDTQASIGIAVYPGHAADAQELIRRANSAMQHALPIASGCAMYTGGQEEEGKRRLALMGDMQWALRHSGLALYCQPKVDMALQRVCGMEALVRWEHPLLGMVSTQELISVVEQAGMIRALTDWVLDAAFRQSRVWHDAGRDWPIAVNLSVHDLYDRGLIDHIRGLFSTWGISPELMQFELTESALMADPAGAVETLIQLKKMGVDIFVDDFGTGYSSLSYLQKLPVDGIKVDQSFVAPMNARHDSAVIVKSTIELGHNLGLKVVAEGVETMAVWDDLMALNCDVAQGYLISRPMPVNAMEAWTAGWMGPAAGTELLGVAASGTRSAGGPGR